MMRIAVYEDYAEISIHYLKEDAIQDIEQMLINYDMKYTRNARYITVSEPIYKIFVDMAENHDILLL